MYPGVKIDYKGRVRISVNFFFSRNISPFLKDLGEGSKVNVNDNTKLGFKNIILCHIQDVSPANFLQILQGNAPTGGNGKVIKR